MPQSYEKLRGKPNLFELFRDRVTSAKPKLRKVEGKAKKNHFYFPSSPQGHAAACPTLSLKMPLMNRYPHKSFHPKFGGYIFFTYLCR